MGQGFKLIPVCDPYVDDLPFVFLPAVGSGIGIFFFLISVEKCWQRRVSCNSISVRPCCDFSLRLATQWVFDSMLIHLIADLCGRHISGREFIT